MVARLQDGSWSAPSALGTLGGGFGGQIGFELTDFVFILNDYSAVRTFARAGSITLGGNVSLAAGPIGRNAEAAGAASSGGVAGVFAYSRTKGLFAGVSLEGSVLVERRDANEKMYRSRLTARQLLEGAVRPPPAADPLMRVLHTRAFTGGLYDGNNDSMYNDMPVYDSSRDDVVWEGRHGDAYGEGQRNNRRGGSGGGGYYDNNSNNGDYDNDYNRSRRANTWQDDVYDRPYDDFDNYGSYGAGGPRGSGGSGSGSGIGRNSSHRLSRANPNETFDNYETDVYAPPPSGPPPSWGGRGSSRERYDSPGQYNTRSRASTFTGVDDDYVYSDRPRNYGPPPGRPNAPKPRFGSTGGSDRGAPPPRSETRHSDLGPDQAIALYTFDADQEGDLGFKKGEIITIVKRTDKKEDWWTGRIGSRTGIFPANYVDTV